jgi:hypothetical protein
MAQTFSESQNTRGGASPHTFDNALTFQFNEAARKLVAIIVAHSLSVRTADEAVGLCIKIESSNWNGPRYFFCGFIAPSGPATNAAEKLAAQDVIALDITVAPSTTMTVSVSSVIGATQTGTHDVTIEVVSADAALPEKIKRAFEAKFGLPSVKGGSYGYATALATTARTALTGNNGTLNVPAEAEEILGIVAIQAPDGAITADQEIAGHVEVDYGLKDQGKQEYAANGGIPNDGTEVDGNEPLSVALCRRPVFIGKLPKRELSVKAYANAMGAKTGGTDWALNILWG